MGTHLSVLVAIFEVRLREFECFILPPAERHKPTDDIPMRKRSSTVLPAYDFHIVRVCVLKDRLDNSARSARPGDSDEAVGPADLFNGSAERRPTILDEGL